MIKKFKDFILNILFPCFCINCGLEGKYLCQDCEAILEILEDNFCLCEKSKRLPMAGKCQKCLYKSLNGLYFALSYKNPLVKKLIKQFKYKPYIKDLSKTLSSLIITHFLLSSHNFNNNTIRERFSKFVLIPVPLCKKKLKQRGFNQAEEIGKELVKFLKIPFINDNLIKRKENTKEVFSIKNKNEIKDKKILLINDIYTTGSIMEECARVLKKAGAKEVWGAAVARR